ncbi:MAG TPA: NAD(P)/FAD-dependent oxidoreductase [Caldimonas sp.]|nr:NAD(P)/FAD-dependent oxidoreductase [Caldimonas sp.]
MDTEVLVVGAGPAGLAVAATLKDKGRRVLVVEKASQVGASWRNHYTRLHLHTVKALSALPGLPFPDAAPRYVPRQGVVDYLAAYAAQAGIEPCFGEEVTAIVRDEARRWRTSTRSGRAFTSDAVVVTTGANNHPFAPAIEGEERFAAAGRIVHSRDYRDAAPFAGQRVLVVGMGNTGAEIALDLAEHGVTASLSVRSPINIVHRDVLGRPTQQTSIMLARLPTPLGDALARLLCDVTVGDIGRYGLPRSRVSPLRQLREQGRTPVIDVGTLARIKSGEIAVFPAIRRLVEGGAEFVDGRVAKLDAIVLATGYRAGVADLFPTFAVPVDDSGLPTQLAGSGGLDGVFFVGFDVRQAGGLLRTIARQAVVVAERIAAAPERPHTS